MKRNIQNLNISKRSENTHHQRRYTNGKQAYGMLFNITIDGQETEPQGLSFITGAAHNYAAHSNIVCWFLIRLNNLRI